MKPKDLISKDVEKVLNYDGTVFLRKAPPRPFPLEWRIKYCKVCKRTTKQERVRNMDNEYWRCSDCLERQIREKGIFIPPYMVNGLSYRGGRLLLEKGLKI